MSQNIFDPKLYKHVKSDKHTTTLKHKAGHTLTLAHNVIGPKMRAALEALSKIPQENATASQAQEAEDQHQYGKIIMKADGGTIQKRYEISKETLSSKEHKQHANDLKRTLPHVHPDLAKTRQQKIAYHESEANKTYMAEGGKIDDGWHEKYPDHHVHKSGAVITKDEKSSRPSYRHYAPKAGAHDFSSHESAAQAKEHHRKNYAEGGDIEPKTVMGQEVYGTGVHKQAAPQHEGTMPGQNDEEWPLPSQTSVGKAIQAKKDSGMAEGGRVKMAHGGISESPAAPGSTASGAYDAGLPCLNPNCKSHGRPHPNCRCYPNLAEGGTVNLRYCAHGMPHEEGCEYASGGKVESNDHLDSGTRPGRSTQGEDVRTAERQPTNRGREAYLRNAKIEAKGRAQMERSVKPKMQKLAEGGPAVPYGMRESDIPKDEHQTEQELDQYEAENPSRLEQSNNERQQARLPEFMQRPKATPALKPGMPGYDEPHEPINDVEDPPTGSEAETDPKMYQKIHGEDNYGRMPAEAPPQPMATNPDEAPPTSEVVDNTAQGPQEQPVDHAADLINENKAFEQDLMNGHIQPKTYNDLMYHNKDGSEKSTLGKIGSIFGLILSSAGAGLAHQPVMALQMMDNTIKNDLAAQMKSKENAQNYFRVNQARMLNDANIQNVLASKDMTDMQKAQVKQGIDMKAAAQSYLDMGSVAVHDSIKRANSLPEGPEKQKAAQVALMVAQAAETNGAKAAAIAAAGINGLSMYGMDPNQAGAANIEQKFQNDMQARENAGDKAGADSLRERHIPGVPGFASSPVSEDMRNKFRDMDVLDSKVKDVLSFAQEHRGSVDPRVWAQAKQKAEELTSFYNKSVDSLGLSKGRLGWLEEQIKKNPTSLIQQLLGNNATLREIRDSNATRHSQQLHALGFPIQTKSNGSAQPQESVSKSGKPIIFRNGRWEYK